jgi:DNA-binding response OmpR family regulator
MTKPLALIIEDNPQLGGIYDVVLQQSGYETEVIVRGDEAWQRLEFLSIYQVRPRLLIARVR